MDKYAKESIDGLLSQLTLLSAVLIKAIGYSLKDESFKKEPIQLLILPLSDG